MGENHMKPLVMGTTNQAKVDQIAGARLIGWLVDFLLKMRDSLFMTNSRNQINTESGLLWHGFFAVVPVQDCVVF